MTAVAVQRQGDPNSAGGLAIGGEPTVRVNQRAVIVTGSPVTPHPPCGTPGNGIHCAAITTGGSGTVLAGGKPIIRTGKDVDSCGHLRLGGSPNVRIT